MIAHVVLFNLREDISGHEREEFLKEIRRELGGLPMVRNFRLGKRLKEDSQYEYMLSMDLESPEALAQYYDEHMAFARGKLIPAMGGEWMGKLNYVIEDAS